MKYQALVLVTLVYLLAGAIPASSQEVFLGFGETYRDNDLTVHCTDRAEPELIITAECQVWDQFAGECLYERMIYHYGALQCIEECEHWNSFDNICNFSSLCELLPDQRAFLRTSCDVFDQVENVCRSTRQELIR
jgi:hypothetical protein